VSRPTTADRNVRLALQLATNKQQIADAVGETHVVDTPLLEVNLGDWVYSFDAKGAKARYIRFYSKGSTESALNEYTELEVYGRPAK